MIQKAFWFRGAKQLFQTTWFRISLQLAFSLVIIWVLFSVIDVSLLIENLKLISPTIIITALLLQIIAFTLNSQRWRLLLKHIAITESLPRLTNLYFIGLSFSMFLPTGAGGDVIRVFQVASSHENRYAEVGLATLQERLFGLAASLAIGLGAMAFYVTFLPTNMQIWLLIIIVCGFMGIAALLYPQWIVRVIAHVWHRYQHIPRFSNFVNRSFIQRIIKAFSPIFQSKPLPLMTFGFCLTLAIVSVILGICMYYILAQGLHANVSFSALCLVVPLVWLVRMLPISPGGLGISEGSFVALLSLFAVSEEKSLAMALLFLSVQICCGLIGAALLAIHAWQGSWKKSNA